MAIYSVLSGLQPRKVSYRPRDNHNTKLLNDSRVKIRHYGQSQFAHDFNGLTNFGGSYIFPTNTKGNFQNIFQDWKGLI